ncbi:MAG: hypothetical protein Q8Q81_11645 [Oxalobacteraceae bacterium]|nr:hypothetical protein [Oxalobacteraceae bacterium]
MKSTLMIKDLSLDKQLDRKSMSAVRGGSNFNIGNLNAAVGGGFASPAIVVAPVTQVDARSHVDTTTLQNFGGFQFAALN